MKRSHKIILLFLLVLALWVNIPEELLTLNSKIIIVVLLLAVVGVLAAGNILWRVSKLEDHPQARKQLMADIKRSEEFYQAKGVKFRKLD